MKTLLPLILVLFLLPFSKVNAQGYSIDIDIENLKDSTIYLGFYYGESQFAKDTLTLDHTGRGTFKGTEPLDEGVYFVLLPKQLFFQVLIGEQQHFKLSTLYNTDPKEINNKLACEGNSEMDLYLEYQQFMSGMNKKAIALRDEINKTQDASKKQALQSQLKGMHTQVKGKWKSIEDEHPKSLIAAILKLNMEVDIPEPPRNEQGQIIDSAFQYKYYKKHYFNHVDFSDERILRTEFFYPKLNRYFEKMIVPAPDTIIKESKWVLDMAEANTEVFKFTLSTLFNKYNNSKIMGMDKALVFFAETYYLSGKADWVDSTWLAKLETRVKEIKPNLVGQKAHNLQLIKPDDSYLNLYDLNAEFTVLFFYEPSCGHCKKTTPVLKEFSEKYWEHGVEVLAIYTQTNKEEWTKYMEDQSLDSWHNAWDPYNQSYFRYKYDIKSTPTIYLLDKAKNIIGKRLDVQTLEAIIENEIK